MNRRIEIALALAGVISASSAIAGKPTSNTTLEQAKAYTDTEVAKEAQARSGADNQEAAIRESVDASLQSDIVGLSAQLGTIQTAVTGLSAKKPKTINLPAVAFGGSNVLFDSRRCAVGNVFYALSVPEGSKITSLKFSALDLSATGYPSMQLWKAPLVPTSAVLILESGAGLASTLASATPGLVSETVFSQSSGQSPLMIEAGSTYYAEFRIMGSAQSGTVAACGVSVTYEEP